MQSVQKFEEGFFIKELMETKDSVSKVEDALGQSTQEEDKS